MPPAYRSSLVNLHHINFQDFSNSLTPEEAREPSAELLESVARTGILHPPILREQGRTTMEIVTGRRRLMAAQQTHHNISAICLVLPAETLPAETLAINLEDTMLRGDITVVEQAIFFQKILVHLDENEAARRFLPALGLEPHRHQLHNLLQLLGLEEHLLTALHEGRLHEGVAKELLTLNFTDRLSLYEVMEMLNLSVGNQKKLSATCRELAARHNTSVMALLCLPEVREILDPQETNIPQKTARLMQWLTDQRFPRLAEAEQEFRAFATALKLPKDVVLSHSPSFEQDQVHLSIPFADKDELSRLWPLIAEALKSK
ncbi:MAG: ParB N-terminal domain-containing protein [Desulfobulbaceae bacterium]|nr:ParB N-terminal domain-containing protein [Desulfobulbaceae bacterium]HIJ90528.1 ParB N-terminal domain-containing protein [Deltaproteobacteria bacterium]